MFRQKLLKKVFFLLLFITKMLSINVKNKLKITLYTLYLA
jgi:hypothetical protein